jgi:hypothetical protein
LLLILAAAHLTHRLASVWGLLARGIDQRARHCRVVEHVDAAPVGGLGAFVWIWDALAALALAILAGSAVGLGAALLALSGLRVTLVLQPIDR